MKGDFFEQASLSGESSSYIGSNPEWYRWFVSEERSTMGGGMNDWKRQGRPAGWAQWKGALKNSLRQRLRQNLHTSNGRTQNERRKKEVHRIWRYFWSNDYLFNINPASEETYFVLPPPGGIRHLTNFGPTGSPDDFSYLPCKFPPGWKIIKGR